MDAPGVCDGLEAVARGVLRPADWAAACRARIAARDAAVRAWAFLAPGDPAPQPGPLHGLPVGVKDVIDVAGMPTRCNSPLEPDAPAASDATAVARLRAAGAVVLGKTVTTEYAFVQPGPTRHPADPTRTPGGSSSGSAAAVADGQVPAALATQTGGSTIRPAAYCGIVGYKPPFGTVPLDGLRILDPAMDTIGVHARCVADAAAVAAVLEARARPLSGPAPRLVALGLDGVDCGGDGPAEMLARAVEVLRAAGLRVEAAALPPAFAAMDAAHRTLMSAAVARGFDAIEAQAGDRLSGDLRAFIHRGRGETQAALAAARAAVAAVHEALAALAAGGAVFLWPSAPGEAPQGMATGSAVLNRPWSLLGYGVVTVPAFAGPAGLPLGLQLIDPAPGAPRLFTAAALAEAALARPTREKTP